MLTPNFRGHKLKLQGMQNLFHNVSYSWRRNCVKKNKLVYPLHTSVDLTPLLDDIGDRHVVMLGEASHGTHEYYTWRTALSKRLIQEKGFRFIAVEGDWPDCYRINRYVKGYKDAGDDVRTILKSFDRW